MLFWSTARITSVYLLLQPGYISTTAWLHHSLVTSRPGYMTAWLHHSLVTPLPGYTTAGYITAWLHHCLVAPLPGYTTAWLNHCLVTPQPGYITAWLHHCLVTLQPCYQWLNCKKEVGERSPPLLFLSFPSPFLPPPPSVKRPPENQLCSLGSTISSSSGVWGSRKRTLLLFWARKSCLATTFLVIYLRSFVKWEATTARECPYVILLSFRL